MSVGVPQSEKKRSPPLFCVLFLFLDSATPSGLWPLVFLLQGHLQLGFDNSTLENCVNWFNLRCNYTTINCSNAWSGCKACYCLLFSDSCWDRPQKIWCLRHRRSRHTFLSLSAISPTTKWFLYLKQKIPQVLCLYLKLKHEMVHSWFIYFFLELHNNIASEMLYNISYGVMGQMFSHWQELLHLGMFLFFPFPAVKTSH